MSSVLSDSTTDGLLRTNRQRTLYVRLALLKLGKGGAKIRKLVTKQPLPQQRKYLN